MDAVYHIGLCLLKDGSTSDAKNYFKELSQHANASWQAKGFLGLAMSFESEKKYEAAENFLQKSIAADETPEALSLLAKVLLKMRKPTRSGEERPQGPGTAARQRHGGGRPWATCCWPRTASRRPLSLAKKALEGNPNSCELLIGSAKINFAAGNYETSKSNSTYAISICPEEASPVLLCRRRGRQEIPEEGGQGLFQGLQEAWRGRRHAAGGLSLEAIRRGA